MDTQCCEITDETALKNLNIVDNSLVGLIFVIISLIISYCTTKTDRQKLIASQCAPETLEDFPDDFPTRVGTNLLITTALIYFFSVTKKTLCENTDCTNCSPLFNHISSTLVLGASLLRLYDIFYTRKRSICTEEQTKAPALPAEAIV